MILHWIRTVRLAPAVVVGLTTDGASHLRYVAVFRVGEMSQADSALHPSGMGYIAVG
ncbi:hypothetical protein [Antrihabitans stalactiti]|uniref:hypothetical protein n=1 Tax=Antrihabitans stalactiti TaxID=2584121 RepID=UPI001469D97B|nr:hypothetical protein [Antrihabitans stalactiti]